MANAFLKSDSLKLVEIDGTNFVVGETDKIKCESCKNNTRKHSVIFGVFVGEFIQEGKTYLETTPVSDIYASKKNWKIFGELRDKIRRFNEGGPRKSICAIRAYTPNGDESLEEIGDFDDISVATLEVLLENRYVNSKEWKTVCRKLNSQDSLQKPSGRIKPCNDRVSA